jgi:hypothetical protein
MGSTALSNSSALERRIDDPCVDRWETYRVTVGSAPSVIAALTTSAFGTFSRIKGTRAGFGSTQMRRVLGARI